MNKPRAVVVECDPVIGGMICYFLELQDISCLYAATGQEGRELIRSASPTMAIVDVGIRGGDAWELLKTIRSDKQTAHLPVVVLSLADDTAVSARVRSLGCELLRKPFSYDELNDQLRAAESLVAGPTVSRQ